MKPIKSLFILAAIMFAPAIASAQGYYGRGGGGGYYANPAPSYELPGGFHNRQGRLIWGFSLGLGGMKDRGGSIECATCNYSTAAGEISAHVGGFLGPRFALMAEAQANLQTLATDNVNSDTTLVQSALMVAAQYWVTPQLWVKGGIGFANVTVDNTYYGTSQPVDKGMALMAGIGYEVLSSRYFSVDLQARVLNGEYKGIDDSITAGSIGVGINWF